ncbi:hypothetical protein BGZ96_000755 [Linnemannia gamsii]|uniref:Uncharacterized protein n=1 Tax=Linnemannia gamsii TaxID=64522 RepID=A0ABQ7KAI6_9FUNG|nr:hypothetical protein BGZ96_000755 [Linnemannia gamsii]
MKARPVSAPPRSSSLSKPTTLLNLRSAIVLVATALLSMTTTASADSGTFELQSNLVSCGGDSANNNAAGEGGSTAPVAVCSPPESKLFNNVRVVNGTPHPGSTGVRGRLYDVGNLCTEKISEKIDRAWIAFLDCGGGCTLSTKLANLQGSNPQAVLIYNQAACTVNSSTSPATAPTPTTGEQSSSQAPPAADASTTSVTTAPTPTQDAPAAPETTSEPVVAPATPTPDTPPADATPAPAAPTQPVDNSPNEGDKGGDSNGDGDSNDDGDGDSNGDGDDDRNDDNNDDSNDDGDGNDVNDDEDNGDSDDSNDGDGDNDDNDDDEDEMARRHPRSFQAHSISGGSRSNIISLEGLVGAPGEEVQVQGQSTRPESSLPYGKSPRPRLVPHPHIVGARRAILPDNVHSHQLVKAMDIADAFVQFPITVAMAEQVTTDYLLKVLTDPAAYSPLPAPLKALKTTVNPNGAAQLSAAADGNANNNTVVITDLMVSISPSFVGPARERKFLTMSEPIFATVIGILSAVVCGVVLMYVVRPLVKRHRKKNGGGGDGGDGGGSSALVHDNESESRGTSPSHTSGSRAGGNGYYGDSTAYTGHNNGGGVYADDRYNDYNPYSSKEAPYSASSTGPTSQQPPPMQEVYSEKHAHSHQKNGSNSAPAIFDQSLPGCNTLHSAAAFSAAAASNSIDSEDPEYAQKQLELLRKQDQHQAQSVPLPASTVATPITATTPSVRMKDIQSVRTRYNWGSNTPTTPSAYSISTPTSAAETIATATPITATPITAEPQTSYLSAFDNVHAAEAMSYNRISSLVHAIPEEQSLEPAAPQDYTSTSDLTPATSGDRNENTVDDDEDDRYSAVSSRNGSDLFYSAAKPRLIPTSIDTSTSSTSAYGAPSSCSASGSIPRDVGGGLASALYRNHRLSMDNPGTSPAVQSPFSSRNLSRSLSFRPRTNFSTGAGNGTDSNDNTPRVSTSNDFLPSRVSMDSASASYRENRGSIDLQTRYQDLVSSSRSASGNGAARSSMDGGTQRASFSDDYRYRLPTTPSSSFRLATTNGGETPSRASISDDARVSMDSQHRRSSNTYAEDMQTRFQDISSSSRGRLEGGGGVASAAPRLSLSDLNPRVSFSENFPSRPSLDTTRANMSVSNPTSSTTRSGEGREEISSELASPMREQRASTANWSRYARRDFSGAAI